MKYLGFISVFHIFIPLLHELCVDDRWIIIQHPPGR